MNCIVEIIPCTHSRDITYADDDDDGIVTIYYPAYLGSNIIIIVTLLRNTHSNEGNNCRHGPNRNGEHE